jgi:hypothetical protein
MTRAKILSAIAILAACAPEPPPSPPAPPPAPPAPSRKEPDRVTVQHVLISFKGGIPKPSVTRSIEEARALAREIFERARKGEDFAALVRENSDDSPEGIYRLCNRGVAPEDREEFNRQGMVRGFGDVCFGLEVGQIGVAEHDPAASPYGWHIIKRLK